MTRTVRSTIAAMTGGLVLMLMLAACAGAPRAIDPTASERLTEAVSAVSADAAAGDAAAASAHLDAVQAELDAAVAAGTVTAARATRIQTAIDLVRADLVAALTPAPAPAPEPEVTTGPATNDDDGTGDKGGKDDQKCPPGKKKKDSC
jgi:ribosomal protein S20